MTFAIPDTAGTTTPDTPGTPVTDSPEAATPPAPKRKPLWRRGWFQWLVGVGFTVALVTVLVLVLLAQASTGGRYDPRNMGPEGAGALVALIEQEGVQVDVRTDRAAPFVTGDTTVVVTAGENLQRTQLDQLLARRPARVILAGFSAANLSRLGLPVLSYFGNSTQHLQPGCDNPRALKAGTIENPGVLYRPPLDYVPKAQCYQSDPQAGGHSYLELEVSGVEVIVISGGFENRALGSRGTAEPKGNAAFMMMTFGQDSRLAWWVVPAPQTSRGDGPATPGVLPDGVGWGILAAAVLLLVVGVWRGRRLGPIISERLPVVVRASETVEGHGRMYHRLRAYDRAAQHLRTGVLARLGRRFGSTDPARISEIVAERGRLPMADVHRALTGPPPTTETELLELKQLLHRIEQEARS